MAPTVPKAAWDPRENQDLRDSRAPPGPRVSPGPRVPLALMERRVLEGNQGYLACPAQMDPRVTRARKALPEPKETRVHLDLRVLWGTQDLGASRAWMEFGV